MTGNQALDINYGIGGASDLAITTHGSDWYFAVCAIMFAATLGFFGLSLTRPPTQRIFHYITGLITLVAGIAYFTMGSGLGQVPIPVEFVRSDSATVYAAGTREIFYVRYIDWFITTPLLLLDLLLTAGLPWSTIFFTIALDEIMIVTGLIGALVPSSYKWGYYVFGCVAFLFVVWIVAVGGRQHALALGADIHRTYTLCGVWTLALWFLYPIAWGISEGGNVIHPDSEAIFYGILDVLAKPVFGALLIFGHNNIEVERLGLHLRAYDEPITTTSYSEKHNGAGTTTAGQTV